MTAKQSIRPPRKLVISITSDVYAFSEGSDCQSAIDIVSECHIVHSNIKEALWKNRRKGNEKKENYFQVIFKCKRWSWTRLEADNRIAPSLCLVWNANKPELNEIQTLSSLRSWIWPRHKINWFKIQKTFLRGHAQEFIRDKHWTVFFGSS